MRQLLLLDGRPAPVKLRLLIVHATKRAGKNRLRLAFQIEGPGLPPRSSPPRLRATVAPE